MTYIKSEYIVPSDTITTANERHVDAIMLNRSGGLKCLLWGDSNPITFTNLDAGTIYPFQVKYIYATNTTSTHVHGLIGGVIAR